MARPRPRKWKPKNPEKYIGDVTNIVTRSSWETRCMCYLDSNQSVLFWNSEGIKIKYFSPVDLKFHHYYPDFLAKMRLKNGDIKTFMIEVKPSHERSPPTTKNKKNFAIQMCTWKINEAKWFAAKEFCSANGIEFMILDEYSLGIKKR